MTSTIEQIINEYEPMIEKLDNELATLKSMYNTRFSEKRFVMDEIGLLAKNTSTMYLNLPSSIKQTLTEMLRMELLRRMEAALSAEVEEIKVLKNENFQRKSSLIREVQARIEKEVESLLSEIDSVQMKIIHRCRPDVLFDEFSDQKLAMPEDTSEKLRNLLAVADMYEPYRKVR